MDNVISAEGVAPCAGAGIETLDMDPPTGVMLSPPARGRGLKLSLYRTRLAEVRRPLRGGGD